jgi:putative transposase
MLISRNNDYNYHYINKKKVQKLMQLMGLKSVCQASKPKHKNNNDNKIYKYPYLLNDLQILRSNQVWATDITYIRMPKGFAYLTALIDVFSRFIVSWKKNRERPLKLS